MRLLQLILVGMPLVAVIGSWLLAGREPSAIGRRPLEWPAGTTPGLLQSRRPSTRTACRAAATTRGVRGLAFDTGMWVLA